MTKRRAGSYERHFLIQILYVYDLSVGRFVGGHRTLVALHRRAVVCRLPIYGIAAVVAYHIHFMSILGCFRRCTVVGTPRNKNFLDSIAPMSRLYAVRG